MFGSSIVSSSSFRTAKRRVLIINTNNGNKQPTYGRQCKNSLCFRRILTKIDMCGQITVNTSNMNFDEIRLVGIALFHAYKTRLPVAIRNCSKTTPKKKRRQNALVCITVSCLQDLEFKCQSDYPPHRICTKYYLLAVEAIDPGTKTVKYR